MEIYTVGEVVFVPLLQKVWNLFLYHFHLNVLVFVKYMPELDMQQLKARNASQKTGGSPIAGVAASANSADDETGTKAQGVFTTQAMPVPMMTAQAHYGGARLACIRVEIQHLRIRFTVCVAWNGCPKL